MTTRTRGMGILLLLLTVGFAGCGRPERPPAQHAPGHLASDPIEIWLMRDCGTGTPDSALSVRSLGSPDRVVPVLWQALRYGPSGRIRTNRARTARGDYHDLRDFIRSGGLAHLSDSVRTAAGRVTEDAYVDMEVASLVLGYHRSALNGLIELHPPEFEDSLRSISTEPSLPREIWEAIQATL